jgi:hypothetical protein
VKVEKKELEGKMENKDKRSNDLIWIRHFIPKLNLHRLLFCIEN